MILGRLLRVQRMQEIPTDSLEMTPRFQQPIRALRCSLETHRTGKQCNVGRLLSI